MTVQDLCGFVRNWIRESLVEIVDIDGTPTTEYPIVVFGSQNAPEPTDGVYLVVHRPIVFRQAGSTNKKFPILQEKADPLDDDVYLQKYSNIYEVVISIEEVRGLGDLLIQFQSKLERQKIQDLFRNNNVGFLRWEGFVPRPRLDNSSWTLGGTLDCVLSVGIEDIEETNIIDSVEIDGDATLD